MTRDDNKGISSIKYNHLNLPTRIVFQNGGDFPNISYIYTATGKKIAKTVNTASRHSIVYTVDYLDGYQYESGKLLFFPTAEGYVKYTFGVSNPFDYVFNYTDHLGKIRLSYGINPGTGLLTKIEENNYYPFGLKHGTYNTEAKIIVPRPNPEEEAALSNKYMVQKIDVLAAEMDLPPMEMTPGELVNSEIYSGYNYRFQGQEHQDELGLNWDSFKWRNYDYAIGRFMSIDPLAEDYVYNGPYNFAENKVISFRELEGLEGVPYQLTNYLSIKITQVKQSLNNTLNSTFKNDGNTSLSGEKNNVNINGYNVAKVKDLAIVAKDVNKDLIKAARKGANSLEDVGDKTTIISAAAIQPEGVIVGETISTTGKIINAGLDLAEGKSAVDVAIGGVISVGIGKLDSKIVEKAVEKGAVKEQAQLIVKSAEARIEESIYPKK